MKLTITETRTIEFDTPTYFRSANSIYRANPDGTFTVIRRYPIIKSVIVDSNTSYMGDVTPGNIEPISEVDFKIAFCKAVAEIAGFEFDPNEWVDQESDVQKEVAA